MPREPIPNEWGGVFGPDSNPIGLFADGPQPAKNPLQRLIVSSSAHRDPLPPHLAQMALTVRGRIERRLRRMLARAGVTPQLAAKPVEEVTRRQRKPLRKR